MNLNLLIAFLLLLFVQNSQAKSYSLNIFTSIGYSNFSPDSKDPILTGDVIALGVLYYFPSHKNMTPVLGGRVERTLLKGVQTYTLQNNQNSCIGNTTTQTVYHSFEYVALETHAGLQINPTEKWNVIGLGNLGYGIYNKYSQNINEIQNNNIDVSEHFILGTTLLSTYKLGDIFSLGGHFIYNYHNLNKKIASYSENMTYLEKSLSFVLMWSF